MQFQCVTTVFPTKEDPPRSQEKTPAAAGTEARAEYEIKASSTYHSGRAFARCLEVLA